jgi:hypothetical protein
MDRRDAMRALAATAGTVAFSGPPFVALGETLQADDRAAARRALDRLRGEPAASAFVRAERGGPRLFVNGRERYPFLATSFGLPALASTFRDGGITMFNPLVGTHGVWLGPGRYEWEGLDHYFALLLDGCADAHFLPRLHLNPPRWWKEQHPEELIGYGVQPEPARYRLPQGLLEGTLDVSMWSDLHDVSLASKRWQAEAGDFLGAFVRHLRTSALASRVFGCHFGGGLNGEWHCKGGAYFPDSGPAMRRAVGAAVPSVERRLGSRATLLRDPRTDGDIIRFYRRFHQATADAIVHFARIVKDASDRQWLAGVFYLYLLENIQIQEAGHLAPETVLACRDIDFIVSPYSYLHTNKPGTPTWESDVVDDAGNWLGRARGVGGDGGYRVPVESLRRRGKLFIAEVDPSTYLEPRLVHEGGSGHRTVEGSVRILERDLGQVFASGAGGWLFDFGLMEGSFKAGRGWYSDKPLVDVIARFQKLGERRASSSIAPVSDVAAVYDAESFFVTRHWKHEEPWRGYGVSITDFFNHWFLNAQARTIHRLGAPCDLLYGFDFGRDDSRRYKLVLMVNQFLVTRSRVDRLLRDLAGSGTTVVWFYAPGFLTPDRQDPALMARLTGFTFRANATTGPMMIDSDVPSPQGSVTRRFGLSASHGPRFIVTSPDCEVLGRWIDGGDPAFARKQMDGWTSVYVGAAPVPVEILRALASAAGVRLWSSQPDIVRATEDAVMLVATSPGERVLTLARPMQDARGGPTAAAHTISAEMGDVRVFVGGPSV